MDTTSSSSGHSTRSGDLGSEVVSSSATTASGLPPSGANVAGGGTDELDQGAKARGHISLGEKLFLHLNIQSTLCLLVFNKCTAFTHDIWTRNLTQIFIFGLYPCAMVTV